MARKRTPQEQACEVAGWRASKKAATTYAIERGYSVQSLYRWAKQEATSGHGLASIGFVRLEITPEPPAELTVEVCGASIRVSRGFDAELLRSVVEALSPRRES